MMSAADRGLVVFYLALLVAAAIAANLSTILAVVGEWS